MRWGAINNFAGGVARGIQTEQEMRLARQKATREDDDYQQKLAGRKVLADIAANPSLNQKVDEKAQTFDSDTAAQQGAYAVNMPMLADDGNGGLTNSGSIPQAMYIPPANIKDTIAQGMATSGAPGPESAPSDTPQPTAIPVSAPVASGTSLVVPIPAPHAPEATAIPDTPPAPAAAADPAASTPAGPSSTPLTAYTDDFGRTRFSTGMRDLKPSERYQLAAQMLQKAGNAEQADKYAALADTAQDRELKNVHAAYTTQLDAFNKAKGLGDESGMVTAMNNMAGTMTDSQHGLAYSIVPGANNTMVLSATDANTGTPHTIQTFQNADDAGKYFESMRSFADAKANINQTLAQRDLIAKAGLADAQAQAMGSESKLRAAQTGEVVADSKSKRDLEAAQGAEARGRGDYFENRTNIDKLAGKAPPGYDTATWAAFQKDRLQFATMHPELSPEQVDNAALISMPTDFRAQYEKDHNIVRMPPKAAQGAAMPSPSAAAASPGWLHQQATKFGIPTSVGEWQANKAKNIADLSKKLGLPQ